MFIGLLPFFVSLLLPPLPTSLAHSTMARQQTAAVLCLAAAVILQLLVAAQAHMVMIEPKSRQWLDYTLRYNYNPHAVNGGGEQLAGSLIRLQHQSRQHQAGCQPTRQHWLTAVCVQSTRALQQQQQ